MRNYEKHDIEQEGSVRVEFLNVVLCCANGYLLFHILT